jgi:pimeloyl-ACP methyl ester carboxylesterase
MPGSSSGPRPRNAVLYRLGVKLISYNRPGYGRSTRYQGRSVADAARDIAILADHLGLERFAIMGRSGGGPHALACAALLPSRVSRAAVLVSFAPAEAVDLDWYREMVGSNIEAYRDAIFDKRRLAETLKIRAHRILHDPAYLLDLLRTELTAADARIVDDVKVRRLLLRAYQDAVTDGPYGWIDDVFALRHDWGFRPESIRVPVRLWHGADDQFAPATHTRWLADRIPGSTIEVQAGAAHFGALPVVPRLLEWLTADVDEAVPTVTPVETEPASPEPPITTHTLSDDYLSPVTAQVLAGSRRSGRRAAARR